MASPSTKVHDKTDKFLDYRKIPTLRHYVIVDTEKEIVECYSSKDGKEWVVETHLSKKEAAALDALGISLSLADIYQ